MWLFHVASAKPPMGDAAAFGNERFDWLTEQFIAGIAKHLFGLLVDERDAPLTIHREQRIWRKLDNIVVWMLTGGLPTG
jgi:hypothetical protein